MQLLIMLLSFLLTVKKCHFKYSKIIHIFSIIIVLEVHNFDESTLFLTDNLF